MAAKKGKNLYIYAFLLLIFGIGYLAFTGFAHDTVYELNVAEISKVSPEKQKSARLSGKVTQTKTITVDNSPVVIFSLEDESNFEKSLTVSYHGSLPDTFKAGSEVIIEGGYNIIDQEFKATKLMTKCPSKYEKKFLG